MNRLALRLVTLIVPLLVSLLGLAACGGRHQVVVSPVTVEPIHMTIDVNLNDDPGDDAKAQRR